MNKQEYKNLIAFHPGYYIKDMIEEMNMTQSELAKRLDTTDKTISKLINGEISLSDEIAQKLSNMLGTSAKFWLNMQATYDAKIIEIKRQKEIEEEKECMKVIDYSFFQKLGIVSSHKITTEEKIKELLQFLKISSLSILGKRNFLVQFRAVVSEMTDKNIINANIWVQTALNIADTVDCQPFDKKKLQKYLPEIRSMTLQQSDIFFPRLKEIFAQCGVAFIVLPHLRSSGINGAVRWINRDKVMLALNDRGAYADKFWFSLFHEIGHIFQEKRKETFITGSKKDMSFNDKDLEYEADIFAKNYLIPEEYYIKFINQNDFTYSSIDAFAEKIGINVGIVIGRLQFDKQIPYNHFNHFKTQYVILANVNNAKEGHR